MSGGGSERGSTANGQRGSGEAARDRVGPLLREAGLRCADAELPVFATLMRTQGADEAGEELVRQHALGIMAPVCAAARRDGVVSAFPMCREGEFGQREQAAWCAQQFFVSQCMAPPGVGGGTALLRENPELCRLMGNLTGAPQLAASIVLPVAAGGGGGQSGPAAASLG